MQQCAEVENWGSCDTDCPPIDLLFEQDSNSSYGRGAVNVYTTVTTAHDWFADLMQDSTPININLPTSVNWSGTCNAYYSTDSGVGELVFFQGMPLGCANSAIPSIIAHEYGHFVTYMLRGDLGPTPT